MKALQFDRFGSPDVIGLRDVPKPEPGPGQIRIAVRACGLNPGDWARIPEGVTAEQAAALPMAAETAWHALDDLGIQPGELLLVHGAGSTVGEAAVRFALHRGIRVIATAGPARAAALEE